MLALCFGGTDLLSQFHDDAVEFLEACCPGALGKLDAEQLIRRLLSLDAKLGIRHLHASRRIGARLFREKEAANRVEQR